MTVAENPTVSATSETHTMLHELRGETVLLTTPALYAAAFLLILASRSFADPLLVAVTGSILFLLPPIMFAVHQVNDTATAWLLIAGCILVTLLIAVWGGIGAALSLLFLPAGLAAVFLGLPASIAVAAVCSFLVWQSPVAAVVAEPTLRLTSLIALWCTVGLVWLTERPLVTVTAWSWSSWEQSRNLLEEARRRQVELKQALADLAEANVQLNRLHRLAQGLREAAEESRRAKEQFVANLSHELRTPLNMIIGFAQMIVRNPDAYGQHLPRALLSDLNVILRNSLHLADLIDDVLDLSQIEAGRMALVKERVALSEIVEAACTAITPLFASKGLYLRVTIEDDMPLVFCDKVRVREILINLLSNAGRFTERGGVEVRAWRDKDNILMSVADTGPGIADEYKQKLFQPFEQADGSMRRKHGGSGLGLSISKAFVELHGGQMWFESQLGMGTTFFIRLPIDPPIPRVNGDTPRWFHPYWHYEERLRPSRAPKAAVGPRFICVETGDSLQRLVSRYLDGAETAHAADIDEALQEFSRAPAQAILVNEASVGQALSRLNHSGHLPYGVPVIACSLPGGRQAATALGVADYLVKPVSQEQLLQAIHRLDVGIKTILIVDDEPEAQQLFQRMLSAADRKYRVLRASSGQEALGVLQQHRVDAILLDLVMPEMDGFQLLEACKDDPKLCGIPVIAITGRDPTGQPIVNNALGITRGGGISIPQLLACIQAVSQILSVVQPAGPAPKGVPLGSPASA